MSIRRKSVEKKFDPSLIKDGADRKEWDELNKDLEDLEKLLKFERSIRRARQVLTLRFLSDKTLEEVSGIFGITRERVRQIESMAITTIKRNNELKEKVAALLMMAEENRKGRHPLSIIADYGW